MAKFTVEQVKDMSDDERRRNGFPPAGSPRDNALMRSAERHRDAGVKNPIIPRHFGTTMVRR